MLVEEVVKACETTSLGFNSLLLINHLACASKLLQKGAAPVSVNSVRVDRISRTRPDLIERLIQPILSSHSVQDVVQTSQAACDRLLRLGVVKHADVVFDSKAEDGGAVDVVLKFKETNRIWAKTGTEIGNYEGNAVRI